MAANWKEDWKKDLGKTIVGVVIGSLWVDIPTADTEAFPWPSPHSPPAPPRRQAGFRPQRTPRSPPRALPQPPGAGPERPGSASRPLLTSGILLLILYLSLRKRHLRKETGK